MRIFNLLPLLFSSSVFAADAQWQDISWHIGKFAGGAEERLALLLPVKIDGMECRVQLDTGANGDFMWRSQAQPGQPSIKKMVAVELAGIRQQIAADQANLALLTPEACAQSAIATVGNGFFEHGTLILDLRRSRFSFSALPLLASNKAAQPLLYARWANAGGHTLVELKREGGTPGYALLDTGAVRFGLAATNAMEWHNLSDGAALAAGAGVRQYRLESWGRDVQCFEKAVDRALEVGGLTVNQLRASYCVDQGFQAPIQLIGVLGLRPLSDKVITLDYLSRRWILEEF